MNMKSSLIKKLLLSLTFVLSFFLGNIAVQAGDYPDRPISVVVAYNPGGATDFQARLVTMMAAHPKKDYLGQPIVIINKPGGGGIADASGRRDRWHLGSPESAHEGRSGGRGEIARAGLRRAGPIRFLRPARGKIDRAGAR